jgi:hypothetical protein
MQIEVVAVDQRQVCTSPNYARALGYEGIRYIPMKPNWTSQGASYCKSVVWVMKMNGLRVAAKSERLISLAISNNAIT